MQYNSIIVSGWKDYELIDSGDKYKLERYGPYILSRPEPQAIWRKSLTDEEWKARYDAHFERNNDIKSNKEDAGIWHKKGKIPESWQIEAPIENEVLKFRLGMTSFKHVGIFPEQFANWSFILKNKSLLEGKKALNLFAYTGGATLALKTAGADVIHLDAIKKTVDWASDNMRLSGLDNIRWIVEDALTFIRKEVKREKKYQCIVLDPPAYGRGTNGERWILDDHIDEMIMLCAQLLESKHAVFILNLYSLGYTPVVLENIVKTHFPSIVDYEYGELCLADQFNKKLPTGIYLRFRN